MLVIRLSVKAPCRQQWSEHPSVLQEHWQLVSPLLQVIRCSLCQTAVGLPWGTCQSRAEDTAQLMSNTITKKFIFF